MIMRVWVFACYMELGMTGGTTSPAVLSAQHLSTAAGVLACLLLPNVVTCAGLMHGVTGRADRKHVMGNVLYIQGVCVYLLVGRRTILQSAQLTLAATGRKGINLTLSHSPFIRVTIC